jgi:hypothetical protein
MNQVDFFEESDHLDILEDLKYLNIPVEIVDVLDFLLPMFSKIVAASLNCFRTVAMTCQAGSAASVELLLRSEPKAEPFLNISIVMGNDSNLQGVKSNMVSRKLINVYQGYIPGKNDTAIDGLPYSELRKTLRDLLSKMSIQSNAFVKAMFVRSGGLAAVMNGAVTFENDFQMLNDAENGVFKAFRVFRDHEKNQLFNVCIQSYMPVEVLGTPHDIMLDSHRDAVLN